MSTRTKKAPVDYLDQVSIPEGKCGDYAITHIKKPVGTKFDTSHLRTALFGGQKNNPVTYDHETIWHELSYSGGVWVTDLPVEQQQHRQCLAAMKGDVLVGGLGLGLAANWLANKKGVKSVTVVEVSKEVIKLVGKHVRDPRGIVKVVNADLFDYLRDRDVKKKFTWAFIDIWQSDGEGTFFSTVCPLRKLCEPFVRDDHVVCWNEDVMRGQLYMGLQSRHASATGQFEGGPTLEQLAHPKEKSIWLEWSAPFFQAVENGRITEASFLNAAAFYVRMYGRPLFETAWAPMIDVSNLVGGKAK